MIKAKWIEAKARGDATFSTGQPCRNGHDAPRWTNSRICVECKRERDREYNRRNQAAHRERARKSVLTRKDQVRAYHKAYYIANRDKALARAAAWARENRDLMRAHRSRNRAKRRMAPTGDLKAIVVVQQAAAQDAPIRCYWCGKKTAPKERHLDHIIPICAGGADSAGNLCISCRDCNLRKNRKMPDEWAGQAEMHLV